MAGRCRSGVGVAGLQGLRCSCAANHQTLLPLRPVCDGMGSSLLVGRQLRWPSQSSMVLVVSATPGVGREGQGMLRDSEPLHDPDSLPLSAQTTSSALAFDTVLTSTSPAVTRFDRPGSPDTFLFILVLVFLGVSTVFIGGLLALHTALALTGTTTRLIAKSIKEGSAHWSKSKGMRSGGRAPASADGRSWASAEKAVEDVGLKARLPPSDTHASRGKCTAMVSNVMAFTLGRGREDGEKKLLRKSAVAACLRWFDGVCDNSWYSCF